MSTDSQIDITSRGARNIDTSGRFLTYFDTLEHLVHTVLGIESHSDHDVYPFINLLADYSYTFDVCTAHLKSLFCRTALLHSDVHMQTALHYWRKFSMSSMRRTSLILTI